MACTTRVCVVILSCLVVTTSATPGAWSKNVLDFMSVVNGDYDNSGQIRTQGKHDFIAGRALPVSTPALPGKAVIYAEWAVDGRINYITLQEVTEDEYGVIHLTLFNFTDVSPYQPRTYNIDNLSSVTPKDLRTEPFCKSSFRRGDGNLFIGTWPECRHYVDGERGIYGSIVSCDSWRITAPITAPEESSLLPYYLERTGSKYPLVNAPDNYVSPCS